MTTMIRGASPPKPSVPVARKTFTRSSGVRQSAKGIVIYGTGGIGKSSLAASAPSPLVLDLERSTDELDVARVDNIETWSDLRAALATPELFDGVKTVVIDSATAAEEMCRKHVIETIKTEKGATVTSIEGYGWGKGYVHLFETWRMLLSDLDNQRRAGRNVVLICHEQIGKVPNPGGDDYIRYQPRLMHSKDTSILHATKEWANEMWFVSYDVMASDGKAKGSGTRTIYCTETATHMAKTRSLDGTPVVFTKGASDIWQALSRIQSDDAPPM